MEPGHGRCRAEEGQIKGPRFPQVISTRTSHLIIISSLVLSLVFGLRKIIMANTPSTFQQLQDRAVVQSGITRAVTIDNQHIRKKIVSRRPRRELKDLAGRIDGKAKDVKSLEEAIGDSNARFLKAEQELSRVKSGMSEE